MKTGLAIVLLLAAIFGVTLISQLSPTKDPFVVPPPPGEEDPPLSFTTTTIKYDPKAEGDDYQNRLFPGFLEVGTGGSDGSRNWVSFVMRALRPTPVQLSALPPSCGKCTTARVATLPHSAMTNYADANAVGAWITAGGVPNPLAGIVWAQTTRDRQWFEFDFTKLDRRFTIPAATDRMQPNWVFLELDFKVFGRSPPVPVTASFEAMKPTGERLLGKPYEFNVTYSGQEPFEVWPHTIAAGEFPEGTEPKIFDVFAYSMTRDLGNPVDAAVTPADPTVSIGAPIRLSHLDCERLAARMTAEAHVPIRIVSAYRYPVTVRRQAEGQSPDVGSFEKRIQFAGNFNTPLTRPVEISGLVTGPVKLDGDSKINLGTYKAIEKTTKMATLVSERLETELELVPDRCEPRFVKYSLGEGKVEFGLKRWPLTLSIAEQEGRSPPWKGVVVLQTKGPNPVTYRFPVEGSGR